MKASINSKLVLFFLIASFLNIISVIIGYYASPDDLGQLAFVIVVFFPASAVISGILSRRLGINLMIAALISSFSVSIVIITRYNIKGLVYVPAYMALTIIGQLLYMFFSSIIEKFKRKE